MTTQPAPATSRRPVAIAAVVVALVVIVVVAVFLTRGSPAPAASASPPGSGIASLPSPSATVPPAGTPGTSPLPSAPGESPSPSPSPAPSASAGIPTGPISYGTDGRLTVLVLGSDWRPNLGGERTDVILVVTIDPATGRMATASIPRDTAFFPRAGGGNSGQLRVNALYEIYRDQSLPHDKVDPKALRRFTADVASALKIEIDYYVMIRFDGFSSLVDKLGGLDVQISQSINDDFYRTPSGVRGAYFPKAKTWHLTGNPPCKPYPKTCHNSLAYARSRHGTVGSGFNNDFDRSRRQQEMLYDGSQKVVANGVDALSGLLSVAKGQSFTNLPETLPAALQLYSLSSTAKLSSDDMIVFSPSKWAVTAKRDPLYTFELVLPKVRAWIKAHFAA